MLGGRSGALDDDRHGARALLPPAAQAFESVEDFEGAVVFGSDPQRHLGQRLGQRLGKRMTSSRAQLGEGGAKTMNRQPRERPGDRRIGRIGRRRAGAI